jgi:hypothetical protein
MAEPMSVEKFCKQKHSVRQKEIYKLLVKILGLLEKKKEK